MNASRLKDSIACLVAIAIVSTVSFPLTCQAQDTPVDSSMKTGANVFPESTVVYVEIQKPKELILKIMEHPLRDDIENLSFVKKALEDDQLKYLPIVFGLIKAKTNMEWDELLQTITEKGVYVGVDEKSGGAALLLHAGSEEKLKETAGLALGMMKSDAESNNRDLPYKISEYRGHKIAKFDGGIMARIDDWLLITNKPALARTIADNLLDGSPDALANRKGFIDSKGIRDSDDLWAYVDLETVREKNIAEEIFGGTTDNAGAELLVGGILEALNKSSQAIVGAELTESEIALKATVPFDSSKANDSRNFFFGPDGNAQAPKRLSVKNPLADIVAYRDIAEWWNSKEDLFDENVIAQLAQADSQLSTLFAGLDFGEDILGQLKPGIQIVATPQSYSDDYQPDVKIPAFAIVGRLQDPDIQRRLRISYKSFVGFLNIQLGMNGQPQLESESEEFDGGQIESATYLIDDESPNGLVHYNFSPSIAFQDEFFIISSTKDLARELLESARQADASANEQVHTGIWLEAELIEQALNENREALVVQNMIEDGNDRETAEYTIDGLLEVMKLFETGEMTFSDVDEQLQLDLRIRFKN